MKLAIHFLNEVGFASDTQSLVSLVFFLLFSFILYVIFRGNKREYVEYGNLPFEDANLENINSQDKTQ